jgi:hypothetical protein
MRGHHAKRRSGHSHVERTEDSCINSICDAVPVFHLRRIQPGQRISGEPDEDRVLPRADAEVRALQQHTTPIRREGLSPSPTTDRDCWYIFRCDGPATAAHRARPAGVAESRPYFLRDDRGNAGQQGTLPARLQTGHVWLLRTPRGTRGHHAQRRSGHSHIECTDDSCINPPSDGVPVFRLRRIRPRQQVSGRPDANHVFPRADTEVRTRQAHTAPVRREGLRPSPTTDSAHTLKWLAEQPRREYNPPGMPRWNAATTDRTQEPTEVMRWNWPTR